MSNTTCIIGGARSGKSSYALELGEGTGACLAISLIEAGVSEAGN